MAVQDPVMFVDFHGSHHEIIFVSQRWYGNVANDDFTQQVYDISTA